MAIDSFIFGGNTGLTYEQLKRRRAVALALASQRRGFPKTVGEGMTYLGESIGDMLAERRLDAAEQASAGYGAKLRREIEGSAAPAATPPAAAPVIPPAAPRPPTPVRPPAAPMPPRPQPSQRYGGQAAPAAPPAAAAGPAPSITATPVLPSGPSSEAMTSGPPPSEFAMGGILNAAPLAAPGLEPAFPGEEGASSTAGILPSSGYLPPAATAAAPPSISPAPQATAPPAPVGAMDYASWPHGPIRRPTDTAVEESTAGPTAPPAAPAAPAAALGPQSSLDPRYESAISRLESGSFRSPYSALGPTVRTQGGLHHAVGKYQVMDFNIGPWTEKHLGRRLSEEEFKSDPAAQDAVFRGQMAEYADRYGPENAARAWIGGPGGVNNPGARARDASGRPIGLSVGEYGARFARDFGSQAPPADGQGGNVRLAAYAPDGGAGAPIPGMGGAGSPRLQPQIPPLQGPPPAPESEQITPTDIMPMPATAQFGPPVGRFSRTDAPVPGVAAAPSPQAPAVAPPPPQGPPPTRPSQEPIPPATPQVMQDPGPPPDPPKTRPLHPTQQRILEALTDPRLDPNGPDATALKNTFSRLEADRQHQEKIDFSDYTSKREGWEKEVVEWKKFRREEADRNMKQQEQRIGLEKGQAEVRKIERELAGKEVKEIGGVIYERDPPAPGKPAGAWSISPGSPGKQTKISETEGKTLLALRRSTVAEDELKHTGVLAKLEDVAKGKAPFGAGNYLVSPEYQKAKSAADAWVLHTVRHESGAAIKDDELPQMFRIYFPQPGDSEQQIAIKDARRRNATRALYDSLGGDAKETADKFFEERKTRRAKEPEGTLQVNPKTGRTRRVIGGHWEYTDGE